MLEPIRVLASPPPLHQHDQRCLVGGPLVEFGCGYQHPTALCTWTVVTACACEHGALVEVVRAENALLVHRVPAARA